ncbi:MAG: hypothetical protein JJU18_02095 [Oceanicaulis sp.]|nr:hypothetical protein [Oceanicaulis sp.]
MLSAWVGVFALSTADGIEIPDIYRYCLDSRAETGCGRQVTSNVQVDRRLLELFIAHAEADVIDMTTRDIKDRFQEFQSELCANSEYRIHHIDWPLLGSWDNTTFYMSCDTSAYDITGEFTVNLSSGELVQLHGGYLQSTAPR